VQGKCYCLRLLQYVKQRADVVPQGVFALTRDASGYKREQVNVFIVISIASIDKRSQNCMLL